MTPLELYNKAIAVRNSEIKGVVIMKYGLPQYKRVASFLEHSPDYKIVKSVSGCYIYTDKIGSETRRNVSYNITNNLFEKLESNKIIYYDYELSKSKNINYEYEDYADMRYSVNV
jgi:hypothetical protein